MKRKIQKNPHAVALGRKGGLAGSRRKLTEQQVLEIRASKETPTVLAQKYGVSTVTIFNVQTKRTWKWLKVSA